MPYHHSSFFIFLLPTDFFDANTIQCFGASQFCSDVSLPLCGLSCSCSSSNSRYSFLLAPLLSSYIDKGQTAFHIVTSKKRYCDIKLCSYRHVESSSLLPSWISHLSNSPLLRSHHHEVNMALLGCWMGPSPLMHFFLLKPIVHYGLTVNVTELQYLMSCQVAFTLTMSPRTLYHNPVLV